MEVNVYTKPDCKQCDLTMNLLDKRGVKYGVASLLDEQNLAAAKSLGYMSAPVVIVGKDGWAGFRPDLIKQLAERVK